ncbi:hypothetical protein H5410_028105 [Solanum commersonii]|uniref:Uncharacterized protein n=1 Tax=Solanum commersonii TaxID=4109 RepID=A0A9J5Z338_SOLCO|nr:hypothetical protein H5410_028105 [Solanum commersonii]
MFKELPTLEKSKNVVTREEFTMQRIKKLEDKLQKVRKENMVKEMTNEMYEVFKRKNVLVDMNPFDINDLRCVIKKNLKKVPQLFYPIPQNMAVGRPRGLTPPMPSTIMDSPIRSPMMDSLMPSPMIDSLMP